MTLHDGLWFLAGAMSGCAVGILAMCVVFMGRGPSIDEPPE